MVSRPLGHNPMRWDCKDRGCFNIKHRPKIEIFAECFPGRINFGDVDGLVEIGGQFLLLEWKSDRTVLPEGQRILYVKLTRLAPAVVFVVLGDAEVMEVEGLVVFRRGRRIPLKGHERRTIETLKDSIRAWAEWAARNKQPRPSGGR